MIGARVTGARVIGARVIGALLPWSGRSEAMLAKGSDVTETPTPAVPVSVRTPADALQAMRAGSALTQCITNAVVTNFTANALLAIGAAPAMTDIPNEAGLFATVADGVLINLGTPTHEQREAAREAAARTERWVLDPVAVGMLPVRTQLATDLLAHRPAIIRANPSEIIALAGYGRGGRGVDATDGPKAALDAARSLIEQTGAVVAISGEVDLVVSDDGQTEVHGGSALLTKITGGGCSLGALMAALLGSAPPELAAVTASLIYAVTSERAAKGAAGPGTFQIAFLDALSNLDPIDLDTARIRRLEPQ